MEKLAGQALSSWWPRGLARLGTQITAEGGIGAIGAHLAGAASAPTVAAAPLPGLAMASPKLAGFGAYGVGALGRNASNAVGRLGPLGRLPYRPIAQTARQLGNPYSPPPPDQQ